MKLEEVDKKKLTRAMREYEKIREKIEPFIDVEPLCQNLTTGKWIPSEFRRLQELPKTGDKKYREQLLGGLVSGYTGCICH